MLGNKGVKMPTWPSWVKLTPNLIGGQWARQLARAMCPPLTSNFWAYDSHPVITWQQYTGWLKRCKEIVGSRHNITRLLGCNLWDQHSHEHNSPLIPRFFVHEEHSDYVLWIFQQATINNKIFFPKFQLFLEKETIIVATWYCYGVGLGWAQLGCAYKYFNSTSCLWCRPLGALKDGKVHAKIEGLRKVPYICQDKQVKPNDGQTFVHMGLYPHGGGRGLFSSSLLNIHNINSALELEFGGPRYSPQFVPTRFYVHLYEMHVALNSNVWIWSLGVGYAMALVRLGTRGTQVKFSVRMKKTHDSSKWLFLGNLFRK